jgi:Ca-activated chloride channel family protein
MVLPVYLASMLFLPVLVPTAGAVTPQPPVTTVSPLIRVADKVTITAADTVDPGAPVTVVISGGRPDGRIELWGPVTQSDKGGQIDSIPEAGGSVTLTAPAAAGSYELRYVNAANKVLARSTLDVAAVPVTLSAPRGLSAGIDVEIEWRGPAGPGDTIQVYDPSNGAVVNETPAEGRPGMANVAVLRGPERLGDYQIRYWSGARQVALRSLAVTVVAGNAWLRSPIEVSVGETFEVEWDGPTDTDHIYQIVDPETDTVVTSQTGSGSGSTKLKAPSKPGAYRLQFVAVATGFILADLPLDVDPK